MSFHIQRSNFMKKKIGLSLLAVAVLAGGIYLGVSAINPVSADTTTTPQIGMMQRGRGGDFGPGIGGVSEENLAAALGISVDKLQTAYQAAFDKALEQAVAADLITQTQADAMKARGTGNFGMHLGGWMGQGDIDSQALLADELGISTDDLTAAVTKAQETALADAVAAGTITQAQADPLLNDVDTNGFMGGRGGMGGFMGGGGMRGGGMHGGMGGW